MASKVSKAYPLWQAFSRWLSHSSPESDWWWKTTGPQLLTLLADAGYRPEVQVQALLFLYHMVSPGLGPRPTSSGPSWKSFMTDDSTPVEYSWKWGMGNEAPEIRYSIEAISSLAGKKSDPLNHKATLMVISQLATVMPNLDLTWFHHFWNHLLGPNSAAASSKQAGRSTVFLAFELSRTGDISAKVYFIPVEAPGRSVAQQISDAIRASGSPNLDAVHAWQSYIRDSPEGSSIKPIMLGIDLVKPAESRLKIYGRSPLTSFAFVSDVMKLGGRRPGLDQEAEQLQDLWCRTLGLPSNFSPNEELSSCNHLTSGTLFYFDVGPKAPVPDVKVYIPVRHYARSDRQIAQGLIGFLDRHGRGEYAEAYMHTVEGLATGDGINAATGVHTYVTAAYQHGELAITSYFSPQLYAGRGELF